MTDGQPSCVCPPCSDVDKNSGPVCSNLINTYSSRCALQTQACRLRRPESVQSQGPCAQGMRVCDYLALSALVLFGGPLLNDPSPTVSDSGAPQIPKTCTCIN